jgi:flagellar basal body rod protein FlgG
MLEGIYQGSAAMNGLERWQDAISQNLANTNVSGYKAVGVSIHTQKMASGNSDDFAASLGSEMVKANTTVDNSRGSLVQSDSKMDCAIDGDGYFQVRTADGSTKFTRDGHFHVNNQNQIVNGEGESLIGTSGVISVNQGAGDVTIDSTGHIFQGTAQIGQMAIMNANKPSGLIPAGGGFISDANSDPGMQQVDSPHVLQGYYEASNVSAMREMVNMILVSRAYEANEKVIGSADSTMSKAANAFNG